MVIFPAPRGRELFTGTATTQFSRHSMDIRLAVFKETARASRKN
jgi:hypothetical protein